MLSKDMMKKNIYIKPELTVISIDGEKTMNLASKVDEIGADQDFAKGGTGSFEWDDFGEEEDLLDEDQF